MSPFSSLGTSPFRPFYRELLGVFFCPFFLASIGVFRGQQYNCGFLVFDHFGISKCIHVMNDQRCQAVPESKRNGFQFSLKTLLAVVTLIGVALGCLAWRREQKRQENHFVVQLKECGAQADFLWVGNNFEAAGPTWMRKFLGDDFFLDVAFVSFFPSKASYRSRHSLSRDARMRSRDERLLSLNIYYQELPEFPVSLKEGLAIVPQFKGLEGISLAFTDCGDADIATLLALKHLRWLVLRNTLVTDACLQQLKKLVRLEHLDIRGTSVTAVGERDIQDALPNCAILR